MNALQRLPNPPNASTPVVPYFVFPNNGPVFWNPPASINQPSMHSQPTMLASVNQPSMNNRPAPFAKQKILFFL
ncbi:hypothetical protein DPMN_060098, partial [Dreissena polymorpha]